MLSLHHIPNTHMTVSAICYGTAGFGVYVRGESLDRLYALYRTAGGNFLDTAHCYSFWVENGNGASERAVGELVRRHNDRDKVVIATKGGHPDGGPSYARPDAYLAPEVVQRDIDESLQRLGLDYVDLYLLHRDDARVPVEEIIDMLNEEVADGRIRNLGASNWTTERIAQANAYAASHHLQGFAVSEPQWSLAVPNGAPPTSDPAMRSLSDDDVQWHVKTGFPVIAYSSTAHGYFAGSKQAENDYDNEQSRTRRERVRQLAIELGCTPTQVALAYLLHQPFLTIPIIGTLNPEHLHDALGAADVKLTREQVVWLAG